MPGEEPTLAARLALRWQRLRALWAQCCSGSGGRSTMLRSAPPPPASVLSAALSLCGAARDARDDKEDTEGRQLPLRNGGGGDRDRDRDRDRGGQQLRRRVKSVGCCVAVCGVLFLLLLYTVHFITCNFFVGLCSPFPPNLALVFSLTVSMPPARNKAPPQPDLALDAAATNSDGDDVCARYRRRPASAGAAPPSPSPNGSEAGRQRDRMLLLSSQKSGSTWLAITLGKHKQVLAPSSRPFEPFRFWHATCQLQQGHGAAPDGCTWDHMQQELQDTFERVEQKEIAASPEKQNARVVGFKLMYDQIPRELARDFAWWASCNDVAIVHFERAASLESFWTMQAEIFDTMQLHQKEIRTQSDELAKQLASNKGLVLEPRLAEQYVKDLEALANWWKEALQFHPHGSRYYHVFYEQVNGAHQQLYFDALFSFLGVDSLAVPRTLRRVHPGTCKTKIRNWRAVREAIRGTQSERACDWTDGHLASTGSSAETVS